MRVLAIDDNELSLKGLALAIKEVLPTSDVICFRIPSELLLYAKENDCYIAFLDIEMWEMNGLELAKALKQINGKINIIFVTAHTQYAIDSYDIDTSDFILKPVSKEKIERAMTRLREFPNLSPTKGVYVRTFGNFEVFVNGKPVAFSRLKSKELLAYLVDRQGASATTVEIAAILWEDKAYDKSIKNQVQVAISDMVKILKEYGIEDIIIRSWNQISVDTAKIKCDYYELLKWNANAINSYSGEYMSNYSWAEMTTAALSRKTGI